MTNDNIECQQQTHIQLTKVSSPMFVNIGRSKVSSSFSECVNCPQSDTAQVSLLADIQCSCYFRLKSLCDRWLSTLVDMTACLWSRHQTSWSVKSAFLWPAVHTKWHAVGGSTVITAWMNIRNTPAFAQTVGNEDRTLLISEVSRIQLY